MENFSLERGNLYDHGNIHDAESEYKKQRDKVLDNIMKEGNESQDSEIKNVYREKLKNKIQEGFIDREYLLKHNYHNDGPLIMSEMVDFLIPQNKLFEQEIKLKPNIKYVDDIIMPTKDGCSPKKGEGEYNEKKIIPRFEIMVDFLKKNNISVNDYLCIIGKNDKKMLKKEDYVMFVLPSLNKMVEICDEEGNATYVIHDSPIKEEFDKLKNDENNEGGITEFYYQMTKKDLEIIGNKLGLVSKINWGANIDNWLNNVEDKLTKEKNRSFTIEEIKKNLIKYEAAPALWLTNASLAKLLKKTEYKIKKIANNYRENNPEWFKFYLNSNTNRIYERYSPELIQKIKEDLTQYEAAPDSWLTNVGSTKLLKKTDYKIKKIADNYRESNPEWFKSYLDFAGNLREHYSPELIQKIKEKIE